MNHEKWWKRSFVGSLIFHLLLLSWIAWVDPFTPKPNPEEDYLDLELVDIKDLPPIPKRSAAPAAAQEAKAIPALKPKAPTTPKTIAPVQKIVSPEEATESAPVVTPTATGNSTANGAAVGGSQGGQGANASGNDGISGRDLSCGPVVVSRGTAVCKTPLRKKVEVRVRISIGKDGKVHNAVVSSSSGSKGADKAAVEAAYKYTFRPAQDKYGNAIASGGVIAVTVQPNR